MSNELLWTDRPIDAVIMWVDGADPAFVASHDAAVDQLAKSSAPGAYLPSKAGRHRDSGELLFLLRSIKSNLPWIRTIHIVTNGQRPAYVDFSQPGINHVSHRDIFPDLALLPNFNTFAIDSCVHRIEGLAEDFIRFSDDFFIGRPLQPKELMGPRGQAQFVFGGKVEITPRNAYQTQVTNCATIFEAELGFFPKRNPAHAPQPRNRATSHRMVERFQAVIERTLEHKFRNEGDIIPLFLYPYFALFDESEGRLEAFCTTGKAEGCEIAITPDHDLFRQIYLGDATKPWREHLDELLRNPPKLFNLNDHFSGANIVQDQLHSRMMLARIFPQPSAYEVKDAARDLLGVHYE